METLFSPKQNKKKKLNLLVGMREGQREKNNP